MEVNIVKVGDGWEVTSDREGEGKTYPCGTWEELCAILESLHVLSFI